MSREPSTAVVVKGHPRFGSSMFAAISFATADVVLCEDPLLLSAAAAEPLVRALSSAAVQAADALGSSKRVGDIPPGDWMKVCAWLVAFIKAPAGTQQTVLEELHTTPAPDSLQATISELQAQVLARVLPDVLTSTAAMTPGGDRSAALHPPSKKIIHQALLAYHLNAHEMLDMRATAVFRLGSKLAHTCGIANTEYKTYNGKGYHIAVRAIEAGELLTTSYSGSRERLMSTAMRRRHLDENFGFHCCCERCCSRVDLMCYLPCPSCATAAEARRADGTLPPAVASGNKTYTGVLRFNQTLLDRSCSSSSSTEVNPSLLPWKCSNCGVSLPDTDSALFGSNLEKLWHIMADLTGSNNGSSGSNSSGDSECRRIQTVLFEALHKIDKQLDAMPFADSANSKKLLALVGKVVGPEHGAMLYALIFHLEMLLANMKGCGMAVSSLGHAAPAGMILTDFDDYLTEAEDSWERVWTWFAGKPELDGAQLLLKELVRGALGLLGTTTKCLPILRQAPRPLASKGRQVFARSQKLATKLLDMSEPHMEVYSHGPLPQVHPIYKNYREARAIQAKFESLFSSGSARALAGSASDRGRTAGAEQTLSMQQLMSFLPSSSAPSSGGKQGKNKGKKGGKKRH